MRAQKCPNNVISTFFNTVHLLPKDLRFEHGGGQTCFLPRAPSNLVTPLIRWQLFCTGAYTFLLTLMCEGETERISGADRWQVFGKCLFGLHRPNVFGKSKAPLHSMYFQSRITTYSQTRDLHASSILMRSTYRLRLSKQNINMQKTKQIRHTQDYIL